MRDRIAGLFGFLAAVILTFTFPASIGVMTQGRTDTSRQAGWTAPKTPWGEPDLQGIWTNVNEGGIPFERPAGLTGDPTAPDALAKQLAIDRASRDQRARTIDDAGGQMPTGAGPVHWYEISIPKSRLWLVTDPPDGKIPPLTPEALKRAADREEYRRDIRPGKSDEVRPGGWLDDPRAGCAVSRAACPACGCPLRTIPTTRFCKGPGT